MKKVIGLILAICMVMSSTATLAAGYKAEAGGITYTVENGEATVTDCKWEVSGAVVIKSEIEGCPVTKIGDKAFENCGQIISITIPDSVTSIGRAAFYRCVDLKEVKGMKNVEIIGERAFHSCSDLEEFIMPEKVKRIEYGTFSGAGMKRFETGNTVTFVDDSALRDCSWLEEVLFGDSVVEIGTRATGCANEDFTTKNTLNERTPVFEGCNRIKTVTLGKGVKYVYPNTFSNIDSLESIVVDEENPYLKSIEGVLFTKDGKSLICYPMGKSDKEYTIPEGVRIIDDKAFYNCKTEKVNAPESLKHIGIFNGVLDSYTNAERLATRGKQGDIDWVYDRGVLTFTGEGILTDVFSGRVIYPIWEKNSVKKIVVNEGITEIGGMSGHINMTELVLPKSLEKIGTFAFAGCDSIESVVLPENVTEIGTKAFFKCEKLKEVTVTSKVPVKIDLSAFYIADGSVIHLPETVTYIHPHAFAYTYATMHGGYGLGGDCDITIDAPMGSYAYTWAIENKFKVADTNSDIKLIDGVLCIKRNLLFGKLKQLSDAFGGTYKESGTNAGITRYGNYLVVSGFEVSYKENGMNITENIYVNDEYVRVPVRAIKATLGCDIEHRPDSLDRILKSTNFELEEKGDVIIIKGLKNKAEEVVIPSTLYGKRVEIDADAFRADDTIKSLVIEKGIAEIPAWAFYGCENLEKVELGTVTKIGDNAFHYCTRLKDINLELVEELGERAFGGCMSLEEVKLLNIKKWKGIEDSDIVDWTIPRRYHERLYYYESVVVFPPFYGCTALKKATVKFPESEEGFPTLFTNCPELKQVMLLNYTAPLCKAEFCNLKLAHHRFDSADRFTDRVDVTIYSEDYDAKQYAIMNGIKFFDSLDAVNDVWVKDGVLTASKELFDIKGEQLEKYKKEVKKLVLTEGITEIPDEFFAGWTALEDVKFPRGLEKIGERAFKGCSKLYWAELSSSLGGMKDMLEVGEEAFKDCTALRQASLYCNVKIGDRAFENCRVLYKVTMSDSVKVILGEGVFNNCSSLKIIDLYNVSFEGLYPFADSANTSAVEHITLCKGFEAPLLAKDNMGNVIDRLPKSVVNVDVIGDNRVYTQYNGMVYTKDLKTLCYCPKSKDLSTYTFPEALESVYVGAVKVADYKYLPESVKLIVPSLTVQADEKLGEEVKNSDMKTTVSVLMEPQNGPDNLFDEDYVSYCTLCVRDETNPEYIEFELKDIKRVKQVALAFRNATSRTTFFDIRVSKDGINFETVIPKSGSKGDTDLLQYFDINRDAKYVRVYGYSNTFNRYWVSITEARVITG